MLRRIAPLLLLSILPLAVARADRGPRRGPPQEAIDACAKARQGDACTVTFRDHTLSGTCEPLPDSSTLACRPDQPPPRGGDR